jgi:hypothetical protein
MPRHRYQTTISLFLVRVLEVEHHHLWQEAELISLHTRGSKWRPRRNHLRDRKLTLQQALCQVHLGVTPTILCSR